MADHSKTDNETDPVRTQVIADFGGRRRILDRRSKVHKIHHPERRCGKDRRSGFDRRGVLTQYKAIKSEKRHEFNEIEQLSEKPDNGVA